jgi:hypothetical protein
MSQDDSELNSIGDVLKIVFLIFPNYCFGGCMRGTGATLVF